MLKEIHLAGSVRTPFGSFFATLSPMSRPPSSAKRRCKRSGVKPEDVKELLYMRTPQFMEMMKGSLNGALDLKRMARDGMNRVHEQFEIPSKENIDGVLMAIRHVERRLLRCEPRPETVGYS